MFRTKFFFVLLVIALASPNASSAGAKNLTGAEIRQLLVGHRMTFQSSNYKGEAYWEKYGVVILSGTYLKLTGTVGRSWGIEGDKYCRTLLVFRKCFTISKIDVNRYIFVDGSGNTASTGTWR
ncbi:hypothetical protein FJV83_31405 [Mesorhizobium sp. WSM4307]|uniref:hypothetical protein n=1 Tax=unclassified Mesorhizobium TaxID=325217 RepID=UPI00115F45DD|nr:MULTISPECIES: hypothetical protein [unclassified Mesorhizobium]TRC72033.1 hypothetical protein FJV81_30365 [Mesorhizobium sp. WSM4315]TRC77809.1 hypothetical protein FJV83_31405 [Mesorhizobium sp. WSM4307]